jgi:hypothetical protein
LRQVWNAVLHVRSLKSSGFGDTLTGLGRGGEAGRCGALGLPAAIG